jgi:O-antigen/teichoic acid export membrane protein
VANAHRRSVSTGRGPLQEAHLSAQAADDVKIVVRGGATQIAGQITQRSISFFFTVVATNILRPGGYGLYRQVAQVLAIGGQLGLAGFNYASMRFIARARAAEDHGAVKGAIRTGLTGALVASVVVCAVLLLAAEPLAEQFVLAPDDVVELAGLFRLGAAYIPAFALMQVLRYVTQAYKTMTPSVVVGNIFQPVVRFGLGIALLLAGLGVGGAVTSLTVSMALGAIAAAWYCSRMLTHDERVAIRRPQTGAMVRFALPQGGSSLLGIQSLGLGIIVVGLFRENREVGLFAVALALQGPGGVFLSGIVNIWAPVVSDLYERGAVDRLESLYQTITRWIATFSFPVYAALIIEPDFFVRFFGNAAVEAASVAAILAVGNLFYSGTGPTGYVLSMTGRPGVNFANSVSAVVLYVVLGFMVVPEHGAVGMAVVDAVVTAVVNAARVLEAKVLVGVQPFGRSFLKPVAATLVAAGVLLLWQLVPGDTIALEIVGIVVAGAVYLVVLKAFGLDPEERYVWDRIRARAARSRRGK